MSKKRACYNCKNMMICELRSKLADTISFGFYRQIITPTDTDTGLKGASVSVYEIVGKACHYFEPFPKEEK